jgi:arylsulfatase A-like enzyme
MPTFQLDAFRLLVAATLAAMTLSVVGCGERGRETAAAGRPNIVLITLDTTRADHLGTYGYFRDTSPHFDAFAAEAITFDRLIVPIATTLPSHLSVLTASHPLEHGVLANATQGGKRFVPAPELVSFAMVAREAGYATAAFVSATPLKRGSGIEVGFDTFDQPEGKQRHGEHTASAAISWLESLASDRPFFLWVHFYDAHFPFEPLPAFRDRFQLDGDLEAFIAQRKIHDTAPRALAGVFDTARSTTNDYDAELVYQDVQLGRLIAALRAQRGGGWQRTSVVVVGDHGEGLCQHGEAAHGSTWTEQLRAPLAIRIPGEPPRRLDTLLTSADILPSLLPRLGVAELDDFLSRALGRDVLAADFVASPILSQDTSRERDEPFKYALTGEAFKYFRIEHEDSRVEEWLFDLAVDPHELRDVASTHTEVLESLREQTLAMIAERRARGARLRAGAAEVVDGEVDPQLLRELCALGYLESARCPAREDSPEAAPSADAS